MKTKNTSNSKLHREAKIFNLSLIIGAIGIVLIALIN